MYKDKISKAVKMLWTSRCNIINYEDLTNDDGATVQKKTVIAENVPCRISYSTDNAGVQTNTTDNISQQIKLFISCDIKIKPGSEIIVTSKNGTVKHYISSGIPAEYTAHQEIMLVDKKVYA